MSAPAAMCLTAGSSGERIITSLATGNSGSIALASSTGIPIMTGFTTTEAINSDKIIEYLDGLSLRIRRKTFVVLDNAKIHRAKKVMCHRKLWENRGLFIFFLPPYSPHLNLAETLWRILKGKWIKPQDYINKDNLFYAANRALANVGNLLFVNFKNHAA